MKKDKTSPERLIPLRAYFFLLTRKFHIELTGIKEVLILSVKKWIYLGDDGEVIAKSTMKKFDSDEDLKRYFFGAFLKIGDEFSYS